MASPSLNLRLRAEAVYARHESRQEWALLMEEAADALAAEREACAKIADDWLATFGERGPTSGAVSAQTWANDAVKDIADEIRKRSRPTPEKQPEAK